MGRFLNPDNGAFSEAVNSEIYIDKTRLLEYTNRVINTTSNLSVTAVRDVLESP